VVDKINTATPTNPTKTDRPHGFTNKYQHWQVEPFKGKIRVPSKITQELPHIEGIEWVYESKIPTLEDIKKKNDKP